MSSYDRYTSPKRLSRNAVIACSVVLLHAAALWALQSGLAHKVVATIVPAEAITYIMAPPAPEVQPPPPAPPPPVPLPPTPKTPTPRPAVVKKATPRPAPAPLPVADSAPSPNAPVVAAAEPAPDPSPSAPAAAPEAPAAPPAPRIEQPSSNAAYLNNPSPGYPPLSRRMGEEGKVVLRVLISADGKPEKIEIHKSSGYERLDRHAQDTVQRWRFVPGKRNGVPEAMWNLVPINFVLE